MYLILHLFFIMTLLEQIAHISEPTAYFASKVKVANLGFDDLPNEVKSNVLNWSDDDLPKLVKLYFESDEFKLYNFDINDRGKVNMSHYLNVKETQTHQIDEVIETPEGFVIEYYSDIFGCNLIVNLKDINYDIERPEMVPIINVNTDDIQSVTLKLNINFMYKEFTLPLNLIDSIRKNNDHVEYYLSCELDEVISKTRWFVKLEEYLQSDEFGFQED